MPSPDARRETAATPSVGAADALVVVLFALALAALYGATLKGRQFGDGPWITRDFLATMDFGGLWTHVLYFPAARGLQDLFGFENPSGALRLLSVLGGACAGGGAYLVARAFGAALFEAACAALLLALSPAWWFFSTLTEVHALHLVCVAFCVALTLLAPWQRPVAASLLVAAALPLVYLSHKSGLFLGPGFVALCQVGRLRRGLPPLGGRPLLLGVGPLFLGAFLFAVWLSAWAQHKPLAELVGENSSFVGRYHAPQTLVVLRSLWLLPLGLIAPLALVAVARKRVRDWRALAALAWAGPPLVFFTLWGVIERGGYALPTALIAVALVAVAFPARTRVARLVLVALVVGQAAWGLTAQLRWDAPHWGRDNRARAQAVERGLGSEGTLIALNLRFQMVEELLPGVREVNLVQPLRAAVEREDGAQRFAEQQAALVRAALAGGPVALELAWEPRLAGRPEADYVAAFRQRVASEFGLTALPDDSWPLYLVGIEPGFAAGSDG